MPENRSPNAQDLNSNTAPLLSAHRSTSEDSNQSINSTTHTPSFPGARPTSAVISRSCSASAHGEQREPQHNCHRTTDSSLHKCSKDSCTLMDLSRVEASQSPSWSANGIASGEDRVDLDYPDKGSNSVIHVQTADSEAGTAAVPHSVSGSGSAAEAHLSSGRSHGVGYKALVNSAASPSNVVPAMSSVCPVALGRATFILFWSCLICTAGFLYTAYTAGIFFAPFPFIQAPFHYGIVIDAGSHGSRLHLYSWRMHLPPKVNSADSNGPPSIAIPTEIFIEDASPGISSMAATDPLATGETCIAPLVEKAMQELKSIAIPQMRWKTFPIFVEATAGMRNLDALRRSQIMNSIRRYLSDKTKSPFAFQWEWARVIAGEEEGVYAWLAVNNALKTAFRPANETVGAIDMGGSSVQMTFSPHHTSVMEDYYGLVLGGKTIRLYSHSYLGYGWGDAMMRLTTKLAVQEVLKLLRKEPHLRILSGEVPPSVDKNSSSEANLSTETTIRLNATHPCYPEGHIVEFAIPSLVYPDGRFFSDIDLESLHAYMRAIGIPEEYLSTVRRSRESPSTPLSDTPIPSFFEQTTGTGRVTHLRQRFQPHETYKEDSGNDLLNCTPMECLSGYVAESGRDPTVLTQHGGSLKRFGRFSQTDGRGRQADLGHRRNNSPRAKQTFSHPAVTGSALTGLDSAGELQDDLYFLNVGNSQSDMAAAFVEFASDNIKYKSSATDLRQLNEDDTRKDAPSTGNNLSSVSDMRTLLLNTSSTPLPPAGEMESHQSNSQSYSFKPLDAPLPLKAAPKIRYVIRFSGVSNYGACRKLAQSLFYEAPCFVHSCSFNGVYQPRLEDSKFVALGQFLRISQSLNLTSDDTSLADLSSASEKVCSQSKSAILYNHKNYQMYRPYGKRGVMLLCWKSLWAETMLTWGLGFPRNSKSIRYAKESTTDPDAAPAGWATGSILYQVNWLPWLTIVDQFQTPCLLASLALLLFGLTCLILYCKMRRYKARLSRVISAASYGARGYAPLV